VLQVVSTFRARSTVPSAAVGTPKSEPLRQVAHIILSNYGNALSALDPSEFIELNMQTAHENG